MHGLSPKIAGQKIYLSHDLYQTAGYDAQHDGKTVILKVDIRNLDLSLLGPDDDDLQDILSQQRSPRVWQDISWSESLKLSGQCTYDGVIPPHAIAVLQKREIPSAPGMER